MWHLDAAAALVSFEESFFFPGGRAKNCLLHFSHKSSSKALQQHQLI